MLRSLALVALNDTTTAPLTRSFFGEIFIHAVAYGLLGIVLLLLGLKMFDWMTPKLDIEKELAEKNMAVALVVVALFLAMGWVIARTVGA